MYNFFIQILGEQWPKMSETKSRKRKKRDVCEENISKLNLDEEMSDDEVEFNIHYFSEISEEDSDASHWTPWSNEKLIGKIKQYVRIKNKYLHIR